MASCFASGGPTLAETASTRLGVPKANITLLSDQESASGAATGRSTREQIVKAFAGWRRSRRRRHGRHRALRPRHVRREGGEVQPAGARHDARPTSRRCSRGCDRSAWSSSTPRARAGPSSKPCPGLAGSCWRRRAPAPRSSRRSSAGRSWTRLRPKPPTPIAMAVSRSSRPSSTRRSRSRRNISANGLLQTEHAILDDNGDKEGSMEPGAQGKDGQVAAVLSLGSTRAAGRAGHRTAARALCRAPGARAADRVAEAAQGGMDPDKYAAELEKLATELARQGTSDSRSGREEQMRSAAVLLVGLLIASAGRRHGARAAAGRRRPSINRPVHPSRAPATPPTTAASSSSGCATTRDSAGSACAWDRRGRTTIRAAKCTS